MNPKQQHLRQATKCLPKTLHKVIQEHISTHKAKSLKNHMFVRSPGQKQTKNLVLQLAITCYNPEFPHLH